MVLLETLQRMLFTGWIEYEDFVPTLTTSDDPTYILTFTGVNLTDVFGAIVEGTKIRWTQNAIVRHGVVVAHSFSTNSTLTVLTRCDSASADYDVLNTTTYPITDFYISRARFADGFPTKEAFTVTYSDTTQRNPTASTTITQVTNAQIDAPIGLWEVVVSQSVKCQRPGGTGISFKNGLSDATNTFYDNEYVIYVDGNWSSGTGSVALSGIHRFTKLLTLAVKDTLYWNHVVSTIGNTPTIVYENAISTFKLQLICAYL